VPKTPVLQQSLILANKFEKAGTWIIVDQVSHTYWLLILCPRWCRRDGDLDLTFDLCLTLDHSRDHLVKQEHAWGKLRSKPWPVNLLESLSSPNITQISSNNLILHFLKEKPTCVMTI
jgi:hypothetical protein